MATATATAVAGAGLWVARHTVDRLSNDRAPDGFTVGLTTTIGGCQPAATTLGFRRWRC